MLTWGQLLMLLQACYMEAIREYQAGMAKHTGLTEEVCDFERFLLFAAGGPTYAGLAPVHRQVHELNFQMNIEGLLSLIHHTLITLFGRAQHVQVVGVNNAMYAET